MTSPPSDRRFARDVARQIDRRRTRRKLTLWTVLAGLIALAASYLTCGDGFGLGGAGKGAGTGEPLISHDPVPRRCTVRVTAKGITVNSQTVERAEAIAICKASEGADVIITGDAREGDWTELRGALEAAGVKDIFVQKRQSAGSGAK